MFLDCIQSRVLSNPELKRLFTIFLFFSVCSCFVYRVIYEIYETYDKKKNNFLIEVAPLKKQAD